MHVAIIQPSFEGQKAFCCLNISVVSVHLITKLSLMHYSQCNIVTNLKVHLNACCFNIKILH